MSLQGEFHLPNLTLTPVHHTRKKCPTYRPGMSNPSTSQNVASLSPQDAEILSTEMASLQFRDLSTKDEHGEYWKNELGHYQSMGVENLTKLLDYLQTLYPEIQGLDERVPYLVVWCEKAPPPPARRPYLIAGLLGVWVVLGEGQEADYWVQEGEPGNVFEIFPVMESIADDLRSYRIPAVETLCQLRNIYFADATAISFVANHLLVELPKMSPEEHTLRVLDLPAWIWGTDVAVWYHNGIQMLGHEHEQWIDPRPRTGEGQCDDSDYVAAQGYFQPGAMIGSGHGDTISAGILVEKDHEQRLTVSIHSWAWELKHTPQRMGDPQSFRVIQGKTHVGHVSSRLGDSDIGLATLEPGVEFRNAFLDLPGRPKKLLHSRDLRYDDVYTIDSFVTGRQANLLCKGIRVVMKTDRSRTYDLPVLATKRAAPHEAGTPVYVQGIYATGDPLPYGDAVIRDGSCGAAIVRLLPDEKGKKTSTAGKDLPTAAGSSRPGTQAGGWDFENTGEVAGFMYWADFPGKPGNTPRFLCYAEVMDPLIDDGWEVSGVPEKRSRSESDDSQIGHGEEVSGAAKRSRSDLGGPSAPRA
ncbi:hypothetical protein B7494_g8492 [Chlorociboria aeruginascens]|nr:hypothetical protein B7494_g8492 [Chlorociboria aeruginascens]